MVLSKDLSSRSMRIGLSEILGLRRIGIIITSFQIRRKPAYKWQLERSQQKMDPAEYAHWK
jgi:hypothetical protein